MTVLVIGGGSVARPLDDDPPGDERPYTRGQLKALLVAWGAWRAGGAVTRGRSLREIVGTTINAGRKHGSKLPVPAEYLDVSIAFANLNPAHRRLGWDGDPTWLQHIPLTKQQRVLWEKYVVGALDLPDQLPPAHTGNPVSDDLGEDAYAREEERRARLGRPREGTSDRAVAGRLGWSESAVRYHASGALDALLAEINDLAGVRRGEPSRYDWREVRPMPETNPVERPVLPESDREYSRRLRVRLAELGVRPGEFARLTGLSRQWISAALHARAPIGELARIKIERALAEINDLAGRRRGNG